jgi:hypothetical protein
MRLRIALVLVTALALAVFPSRAADTLPLQLSDAAYWKMITDFSEPDGYFQLEIITSNEVSYQYVLPQATRLVKPGGAYLGVGPEQNFTYIAALQPKIAFLIDIRRDMMLEHLMYKAVFEMSADRAEFIGNLFSRKRPGQVNNESSVDALFQAYAAAPADRTLANDHLNAIITRLKTTHRFTISQDDENRIRSIYLTFFQEGVLRFGPSFRSPGYASLMTMTDRAGRNWSFLVSKENYDRVRAMHQNNLIIPLTGDFAGPKTLHMTGQYLRDHGAVVDVFYISNVEDYIQAVWPSYLRNLSSLPLDTSSTFIHWSPSSSTSLASISDFLRFQTQNIRR